MAGFLETTGSITCKDYYGDSIWQQSKVSITISSAGKVSWTNTMTNYYGKTGWGVGVKLYLKIADKVIYDGTWTSYPSTSDSRWTTYPTGYYTSASGSFTLSDTSDSTVKVTLKVSAYTNSTSAYTTKETTINRKQWTNVAASAPTITDNGNNTFTITGKAGTAGTNNAINSTSLYYKIGAATTSYTKNSSLTLSNKALTASASTATQEVAAYTKVDGVQNNDTSSTTKLVVKNYQAPGKVSNITISPKTKTRLTIKEAWNVAWNEATATNSSSPVSGYRIRIYKKAAGASSFNTIKFYSKTTGELLSSDTGSGADRYYYDRGISHGTTMTMYPDIQGILPGDTIKITMQAYSKNGNNTKLLSDTSSSTTYLVQNAGVVRVKVGDSFAEGLVYIRTNDAWKEADVIQVNVGGAWKESE